MLNLQNKTKAELEKIILDASSAAQSVLLSDQENKDITTYTEMMLAAGNQLNKLQAEEKSPTKYSDAIRASFERNDFPRYTMAFVSNKSEQDIIDKLEDGAQAYEMDIVVLIPYLSGDSENFTDTNANRYKYAIAINEAGEFIHE